MNNHDLEKELQAGINVFDIFDNPRATFGFTIVTYPLPGESDEEHYERDTRNFQRAFQIRNPSWKRKK